MTALPGLDDNERGRVRIIAHTDWRPVTPAVALSLASRFSEESGATDWSGPEITFNPASLSRFINLCVAHLAAERRRSMDLGVAMINNAGDLATLLRHQFITVEHALSEWAEEEGQDDLRRRAVEFVTRNIPSVEEGKAPVGTAGFVRVASRMINGMSFLEAVIQEGEQSWALAMLRDAGLVAPTEDTQRSSTAAQTT